MMVVAFGGRGEGLFERVNMKEVFVTQKLIISRVKATTWRHFIRSAGCMCVDLDK